MTGPYHPPFVHFPIALYFLGVFLTGLYLWRGDKDVDRFAYWSFFLSWLTGIVASLVGLVDRGQLGSTLSYDDPRLTVLDQHITQAILFIIISGLVSYSRFRWPDILRREKRWWYLGLVGLGAITLIATGWLGGELVYQWQIGLRK